MEMVRPTLLVAEPEPLQALSVRKLVLETAKYNVITAHSTEEAFELVQLFPNISAAVVVRDSAIDCEAIAEQVKKVLKKPVIAVSPQVKQHCKGADHQVSSYEPQDLLDLARSLLGDPREMPGHKHEGAEPHGEARRAPEPARRPQAERFRR
jgi:DNA-binding LytR/AlgR family response regulator